MYIVYIGGVLCVQGRCTVRTDSVQCTWAVYCQMLHSSSTFMSFLSKGLSVRMHSEKGT